jgi:hypothetical protein
MFKSSKMGVVTAGLTSAMQKPNMKQKGQDMAGKIMCDKTAIVVASPMHGPVDRNKVLTEDFRNIAKSKPRPALNMMIAKATLRSMLFKPADNPLS